MHTALPSFIPANRTIKLTRPLAALALLAGLGACSNFNSLRSPVFTGSTNQDEIIAGQPGATPLGGTYVGVPAGVQSADLPPPSGAGVPPAYGAPGVTPTPAYAAAPRGPQPYTPPGQPGATGTPMPVGQFATAQPQPVKRGAPPTTLNEQAARIGPGGGAGGAGAAYHTVQAGDTAWNISRRYGITVDALIAANGGSATVKLGQRVAIPGRAGVQVASLNPQAAPAPRPVAAVPAVPAAAVPAAPQPASPVMAQPQRPAVQPAAVQQAALPPATTPQAISGGTGFRWPARGRIISGFGKKPNGERNDGINLAVPEGTSVKAAEDGTVIYAGNELKSYGNLVLIRHSGGWVSAYAHNSNLKVKRGEEVRRGQVIALSGMSGGVTTPQIHFELRKDAAPVDPLKHLTES